MDGGQLEVPRRAAEGQLFRFPDPKQIIVQRLNRRWGQVKLPKLGWVRFRWTRPLGGAVRNATVLRDGGRWYVSFCIEDGVAEAAPNGLPPVGVDRGVATALATSDGELLDREFATTGELRRIKRSQRRLARSIRTHGRNRSSRRRDAVRAEIGRLCTRIRARRADFATQTAHRLTVSYGLVAVEDLKVKNMTASARGTPEVPRRNVKQKAGLDNRKSQAVFRCVACARQAHADVNAAKNILAAGLAVTGRGDLAIERSVKRQPSVKPAA